jgi:hypothetical protein
MEFRVCPLSELNVVFHSGIPLFGQQQVRVGDGICLEGSLCVKKSENTLLVRFDLVVSGGLVCLVLRYRGLSRRLLTSIIGQEPSSSKRLSNGVT